MRRVLGSVAGALVYLSTLLAAGPAAADDKADCRSGAGEVKIAACTRLIESRRLHPRDLASVYINRSAAQYRLGQHDAALADVDAALRLDPNRANGYYGRGLIHGAKRMPDQAIADYGSAIRLDPRHRNAYMHRAQLYAARNDHDRAIADFSEAIRIDPRIANGYHERARVHARRDEHDRAIADFSAAIRADARNPHSFNLRGLSHAERRDHDRAIADYSEAIRLSPRLASAYNNRGIALSHKGEYDRALADLDESVRLAPNVAVPYRQRAIVYEKKGILDQALQDFRQALALDPRNQVAQEGANRTEAALRSAGRPLPAAPTQQAVAPAPPAASFAQPSSTIAATGPAGQAGSRVALVIGNGAYRHSAKLANPTNDALDIAAALRRLGFDVVDGRDLDKRGLEDKVREFGRKLDRAGVALFFYAGHGIQVGGKNYLIPVDAKLERPGDLALDAIDVGQVLAQMEAEQRVNLVFLDACRDNPLARSFATTLGTRSTSVGSGLASIQSAIGTMIAYATQPDNVALDGTGRNSPFTAALLKHLATPGLDISAVMRRVRTDVVAATRGKQVPWDHSSLMGDVVLVAR